MASASQNWLYGVECPHCTRRVCQYPTGRFTRHNYPGDRRGPVGWTDPLTGWRCPMSYRLASEGPLIDYPARHRHDELGRLG